MVRFPKDSAQKGYHSKRKKSTSGWLEHGPGMARCFLHPMNHRSVASSNRTQAGSPFVVASTGRDGTVATGGQVMATGRPLKPAMMEIWRRETAALCLGGREWIMKKTWGMKESLNED